MKINCGKCNFEYNTLFYHFCPECSNGKEEYNEKLKKRSSLEKLLGTDKIGLGIAGGILVIVIIGVSWFVSDVVNQPTYDELDINKSGEVDEQDVKDYEAWKDFIDN